MPKPKQTAGGIWRIIRASDILHDVRPLVSNAGSKARNLAVERYKSSGWRTTPRVIFENQHLVGIQWTGQLQEIERGFRSISVPKTVSIFPFGMTLPERIISDLEFTSLSLSPAFLEQIARELDFPDGFELAPQWAIRDEQIEGIARAAESEIKSDLGAGNLFMDSLATAMGAHLLTRYATRRPVLREYRGGMSPYQLQRTIDYIEANLGEDFGLAELAANVRMSPYYFCRLFKRSTSLSPHQFVIRRRIDRSRQLLREHRFSVVEIADQLGFSDQSHFSRVFRELVGTTPKRYSGSH